jgi:hypothetical protein
MKNLAKLAQLNVRVPDELYVQMRIEAIRQRVSLQSLVSTLLSWGSREIEGKTKTGQLLLNELDGDGGDHQKPVAVEKPRAAASPDDMPRVPATGANPANFFRAPNPDGDAPVPSVYGSHRGQARGRAATGVHPRTQVVCEPVC